MVRLVRSISGKKMVHGQLLALCPHDGERFFLAQTTWLMQERGAGLIRWDQGLTRYAGSDRSAAARANARTKWQASTRAFLLPAIPAIDLEASLVLPQGWFRPGRVVELFIDGASQVKLLHILDDGPDFERVSFALC